ncbi:flippase [Halomonas sp. ND22Bw]|nr:flippase [Halomonas sp. ND22Bw]
MKASHALATFALAVVLARVLGAGGYGVYAFALSFIMLLAIPAQVGLPHLVVRETAKAQANQNWGVMRGLWRWGNHYVMLFSLGMAILGLIALWLAGDWLGESRRNTLGVGLALVPLIALGNIRGAALRGLRKVILGQLSEIVLRPTLTLLLVTAVFLVWQYFSPTPVLAMGLHAVAALMAFLIGAALLIRERPSGLRARPKPEYQSRYWRKAAIPMAILVGLQLINAHADILILGVFREDDEVGVYKVVVQVATLVVFGLQSVNQVVQPHFARLYEEGDMSRLQKLVTSSARVILLIAIPPTIVMILWGAPLLELLFGSEYRVGYLALGILGVGQLINASMGSVGILLNMTGHERDTLQGVALAAAVNVVLNIILIPNFGMAGSAIATAVSISIWNILLWRVARKKLKISSSALSF